LSGDEEGEAAESAGANGRQRRAAETKQHQSGLKGHDAKDPEGSDRPTHSFPSLKTESISRRAVLRRAQVRDKWRV
jgi:hypothetical protein